MTEFKYLQRRPTDWSWVGIGEKGQYPQRRRNAPSMKTSLRAFRGGKNIWNAAKGSGFSEGSYAGVASDPSGYNVDYGGNSWWSRLSNLFGSEGVGAGEGIGSAAEGVGEGASSAWPVVGYVAAAIVGQHGATTANSREFEGVPTGDAFSGQFATEPWYAKLSEMFGWEPTSGERFDAAVKNSDQELALRRLPLAVSYWTDPVGTYLGDFAKNQWGDLAEGIFNPIGLITGWFD